MAGGHIGIAVFPNMRRFHEDILAEVRKWDDTKIEIPLEVDLSEIRTAEELVKDLDGTRANIDLRVDEGQLVSAEERINNLDGREIRTRLRVDTDEIDNTVRRMESINATISSVLDVNTDRAEDKMQDFQDKWDTIHTHLVVHRVGADKEMDDFFLKYRRGLEIDITPKIGPMPSMPGGGGGGAGAAMGIERWQASTFMPLLWEEMNKALTTGIDKIYSPYVQQIVSGAAKMRDALEGAFGMVERYGSADTLGEFLNIDTSKLNWQAVKDSAMDMQLGVLNSFMRMSEGVEDVKFRFRSLGDSAKDGMRRMNSAVQSGWQRTEGIRTRVSRGAKGLWSEFLDVSGLGDTFSDISGSVRSGMTDVGQRVRNGMFSVGEVFRNGSSAIKGAVPGVMEEIRVSMILGASRALDGLTSVFNMLPAQVQGPLVKFGEGFSSVWATLANNTRANLRGMREDLSAFGAGVRRRLEPVGAATRWVGEQFGNVRNRVGGFLRDTNKRIRGWGAGLSKSFKDAMDRIGPPLQEGFRRIRRFGGTMLRGIGTMARRAFNLIGRGVAGVLNSPMLKRAIGSFGRMIGNYVGGFARILTGTFAKMGGILVASLLPALQAVGAGIAMLGVGVLAGQVMALAGAVFALVQGALLLAPAFIAAAGVSFFALKLGLDGVGEAVKSAFSAETVEEFEEAIAEMPASVQEVARAFRTIKPAVEEMKTAVQDNLLEGLRPGIEQALGNLFPQISRGMQENAKSWNRAFKGALDELGSERAGAGMTTIMDEFIEMSKVMEPAIGNIISAFGSLAEQGAKYLVPIGNAINNMTQGWFEAAEAMREPFPGSDLSRFDAAINRATDALRALGTFSGGIFGTIGNVLVASAEGGTRMLTVLGEMTQGWKEATAPGTEGFRQIQEFVDGTVDSMLVLNQIIGPLFSALVDIGAMLVNLASGALPHLVPMFQALDNEFVILKNSAKEVGDSFGGAFASLTPIVNSIGEVITPLLLGIMDGLTPILYSIGGALNPVLPMLQSVAAKLGPIFGDVGNAIARIVESIQPAIGTTVNILDALMGPLGAFVVQFGRVVQSVLTTVMPMFTEHDAAIMGLLDQVTPLIDILGQGLVDVAVALRPAFEGLGRAFGAIFEAVTPLLPLIGQYLTQAFAMIVDVINWLTPVVLELVDIFVAILPIAIDIVVAVFTWLLQKVQDVWPVISQIIQTAIGIALPIIRALGDFIVNVLFPTFLDLLNKVIIPVFNGVSSIIGTVVNTVVIPILRGLWTLIKDVLGPIFTWLWRKIVQPAFEGMQTIIGGVFDFIEWAINRVVIPVVEKLGDIFETVAEGIGKVWGTLKQLFSEPITFFIDTVLNGAVGGAWDFVMVTLLGQDDKAWTDIAVPEGMRFARGGVLPGYSPNQDIHEFANVATGQRLHLSGGEAIMRPEFTRAMGGPAAIDSINHAARTGKLRNNQEDRQRRAMYSTGGVLPEMRFANGGVINAMMEIVRQKYPMLQMTSGYRPGGPYHGTRQATDWSNGSGNTPAQLALARDIAATYPGSAELIYDSPGWAGNIKHGSPMGAMDSPGGFSTAQAGRHDHHVHWAMTVPPTMPFGGGVFEGGSDGGSGGGGFFFDVGQWIKNNIIDKFLSGPINSIKDEVAGYGQWATVPIEMGKKVVEGFTAWAMDRLKSWVPDWLSGGNGARLDLSGVAGSNLEIGEQLAAQVGWTGAEWEALKTLWTNESGWDHNAQNPASTAYGIAQFLDSTWPAYGYTKTSDPAGQIEAGIGYIQKRYGTPSAALAFWNAQSPHWYDAGGEAHGVGIMGKNVLMPERVLSPTQTAAFNDFIYRFLPELIRSYKNRPFEVRQAVSELIDGWNGIQRNANAQRALDIENMTDNLTVQLARRSKGESTADVPVDIQGLVDRFSGRNVLEVRADDILADADFMERWYNNNQANLKKNLTDAVNDSRMISSDPQAYLDAERAAKERIDAEEEAAKEARDEEIAEEQRKKDEEERNKREEERDKIREGLSEKDLELKEEEWKRQDEERKADEKAQQDRIREAQQAEDERIQALKDSGEYYYGYKTFDDEGNNPNAYEDRAEVAEAKRYAEQAAEFAGLSGAYEGVMQRIGLGLQLGSNVQTAMPAWQAAAQGDRSGLNHNIAAGQAAVQRQTMSDAVDLAPSALFGALEMVAAGTASTAPFIGTVNSGMTPAQLNSTLTHYEATRARRGTGTIRTR